MIERGQERLSNLNHGVKIKVKTPQNSKLQISDGDVFIENISSGVIMKSSKVNCRKITVQNDGSLKSDAIVCPNKGLGHDQCNITNLFVIACDWHITLQVSMPL